MHERNVYHGKLHGENIIIRETGDDMKLCLVDYAYANLCTRDAINLLVNATPSFCGGHWNRARLKLRLQSASSARDLAWPAVFSIVGHVAVGYTALLLVGFFALQSDSNECV